MFVAVHYTDGVVFPSLCYDLFVFLNSVVLVCRNHENISFAMPLCNCNWSRLVILGLVTIWLPLLHSLESNQHNFNLALVWFLLMFLILVLTSGYFNTQQAFSAPSMERVLQP
jgi:hypothetical protein